MTKPTPDKTNPPPDKTGPDPATKKFDPVESLASLPHEFGEHGGVNMSISASTTFTVMAADTMPEIFMGQRGPDHGGCYLYGRHFNPTVSALGRQVAALEGAQAGYCTSSGMSAIAASILQVCDAGDHIVAGDTLYGGTYALLNDYLPAKAGITASHVPINDLAAVDRAFTARTRVLYVETMANPTLRVANIGALADIAHRRGATLIVDNTFCPLVVSPIQHGADVVVYSATKFLNGTSDIIAGIICSTSEFVGSLMDLHMGSVMLLGPTMDPHAAFGISMRLPHLGLRIKEHSARAMTFARRLDQLGAEVIYPGLANHPDHALLGRLANAEYGAGGVLCLNLGTAQRAHRFMEHLQSAEDFGYIAVSLGYFDTLMSCPASSTSSEMPDDALVGAGVLPGLVRLSVGYTGSVQQRWEQLDRALIAVGAI